MPPSGFVVLGDVARQALGHLLQPLGDETATFLHPGGAHLEVGPHGADACAVVLEVLAGLGHGTGPGRQLLFGGLELREQLLELADPCGLPGVAVHELTQVGTERLELRGGLVRVAGQASCGIPVRAT